MATKKTTKKIAKVPAKKTVEKRIQKTVETKSTTWHSNKPRSNKIMFEVKDVVKNYGSKHVLKHINLKVYEGERLAIIGPNGAGKSTLTEIIAGIKEPTSGKVEYSFGNTKADIGKNIGIQFQESSYPMFVKVDSIVKFFIEAAGIKINKDELDKLLELFNLKSIYKQMAMGLSGGQRQRLNILLAVIHNPSLLLLDEVGTGLDVETRTNVKNFIRDYLNRTNSTSIIVSHNSDEVMALADRIIVIYDGIIFEDILLKDILKKHNVFEDYIDDLFLHRFKEYDKKNPKKVEVKGGNK